MKVFILLGHPNADGTLSSQFADHYERQALLGGHEVRRTNLGALSFDPILHKGYREIQPLESDLTKLQEDIKWCEHFVLVYPLWWGSVPALLKGLIDRMWLPAFAYRFIKTKDGKNTMGWHRLLKGRSARMIVLLKNFAWLEHFMYGDFTSDVANVVLRFSGFKTKVTEIGNSEALTDKAKARWMKKIGKLATKAQ